VRSPPLHPLLYFRNRDRIWEDQGGEAMSIARTHDRASSRDSGIRAGLSTAGSALLAIASAIGRFRRRGERIGSELPLSDHLLRDIGLPADPSRRTWREG
jgi:uncharacterized protein YjiS (DUF1127 family)